MITSYDDLALELGAVTTREGSLAERLLIDTEDQVLLRQVDRGVQLVRLTPSTYPRSRYLMFPFSTEAFWAAVEELMAEEQKEDHDEE